MGPGPHGGGGPGPGGRHELRRRRHHLFDALGHHPRRTHRRRARPHPYTTWGGYGGLTFRGHGDWRDTSLGTAGVEETDALRGERSPWCRLEGPLEGRADGAERAGIAILDHPANPRHPTPWYASTRSETYGEGWSNFANAAFLWDGALALGAGERLRQRYLVLTWDGSLPRNHLEAAFDRWATT
ncbi:MAG: DUF6807 family protein [Microthrixaceae bacterium]